MGELYWGDFTSTTGENPCLGGDAGGDLTGRLRTSSLAVFSWLFTPLQGGEEGLRWPREEVRAQLEGPGWGEGDRLCERRDREGERDIGGDIPLGSHGEGNGELFLLSLVFWPSSSQISAAQSESSQSLPSPPLPTSR